MSISPMCPSDMSKKKWVKRDIPTKYNKVMTVGWHGTPSSAHVPT